MPAFTRLPVDERRRQLIEAGSAVFAEHAFEEISMREIARAAGISKGLLYHYFPSKAALFKAAVEAHAEELAHLVEPTGNGPPLAELAAGLDAYLGWIEAHARAWAKLMESAASVPEAGAIVEGFRARTLEQILARLGGDGGEPRPALRTALRGWLGCVDAATLDWIAHGDLSREQLGEILLAAFGAALLAGQQADPGSPGGSTERAVPR